MSRSTITKRRTLKRIANQIGRPVLFALARGNTGHRIDACLPDRSVVSIWPDGSVEATGLQWSETVVGVPDAPTFPDDKP